MNQPKNEKKRNLQNRFILFYKRIWISKLFFFSFWILFSLEFWFRFLVPFHFTFYPFFCLGSILLLSIYPIRFYFPLGFFLFSPQNRGEVEVMRLYDHWLPSHVFIRVFQASFPQTPNSLPKPRQGLFFFL